MGRSYILVTGASSGLGAAMARRFAAMDRNPGAVRGLPRSINAYAASKAAVSAIGEALQAEFLRSPIVVSTIPPSSGSRAGPACPPGRGGRWTC